MNNKFEWLSNNAILYTRYPIVARHAWPAGCIGCFRPNASRGQRYLAYKRFCRPLELFISTLNWPSYTAFCYLFEQFFVLKTANSVICRPCIEGVAGAFVTPERA